MPVLPFVKRIVESFGGKCAEWNVGDTVIHPKMGKVILTSGQYWGEHGVSNFWNWRKVKNGKPYGKTYHGYGWA